MLIIYKIQLKDSCFQEVFKEAIQLKWKFEYAIFNIHYLRKFVIVWGLSL